MPLKKAAFVYVSTYYQSDYGFKGRKVRNGCQKRNKGLFTATLKVVLFFVNTHNFKKKVNNINRKLIGDFQITNYLMKQH